MENHDAFLQERIGDSKTVSFTIIEHAECIFVKPCVIIYG